MAFGIRAVNFKLVPCLLALCLAMAPSAGLAKPVEGQVFPAEQRVTYVDPAGKSRIYLVQESEKRLISPTILVYMHGSAGGEEQGMDPRWANGAFSRLRQLMNRWGWVYVCPRDGEFEGLLRHLGEKYKSRRVFLCGASYGGTLVLREAAKNPDRYAGLLLLGPAVGNGSQSDPSRLSMPTWILSGERDYEVSRQARILAGHLKELKRSCFYREIAGGRHSSPVEKVDWLEALGYLQFPRVREGRLTCL
ncbi:MAG: alpha/beta hydrolase [Syntrophotaleaceae bacterium]